MPDEIPLFYSTSRTFWKLFYLRKLHKYKLPKTLICPIGLADTAFSSSEIKRST